MSLMPHQLATSVSTPDDGSDHHSQTSESKFIAAAAQESAQQEAQESALHIKQFLKHACETTEAIAERLEKIKLAENPLLEAAEPLLLALARLPDLALHSEEVTVFHALLVREVDTFQSLCTQANLTRDHVIAASFALCTALDEAANGTCWGGAVGKDGVTGAAVPDAGSVGVWASHMLAAQFHADTEGGSKIFKIIGRLLTHQPQGHIDLLEVLYRVISLGFEGQYRAMPEGRRQHETVRQQLYSVIAQARGPVPRALSPQWRGAGSGKFKLLRSVPVWVTASVLGLVLLAQFAWYKYQLLKRTEAVVSQIVAIGKMTPPPVAVVAEPLRLAVLLQDDIALGLVSVIEDAQRSRVVLKGDDMFGAGRAEVNAAMLPLLMRMASEIARVAGVVQITGHSDNLPIKTRRFPNNQVLSEQRANSVAEALQAGGVSGERLLIRGLGDSAPLADNATLAGRAQNRRVEIDVHPAATTPSAAAAAKSTALTVSVP